MISQATIAKYLGSELLSCFHAFGEVLADDAVEVLVAIAVGTALTGGPRADPACGITALGSASGSGVEAHEG